MYNYFKGTVAEVSSAFIVIEVNSIGYELKVPNPFYYQIGNEVIVYSYLHVREDIMDLYGFKSKDEKEFFKKLLGVKGIGPKSALAILASGNVNDISQAIEAANDVYLTKFPGIGPKAAKQIVLDLKGKVNVDVEETHSANEYSDVVEALLALGYKKKEIEKLVVKLEPGLDESQAIKLILQQL